MRIGVVGIAGVSFLLILSGCRNPQQATSASVAAGDGGPSAEMVQNRDMEAGTIPEGGRTNKSSAGDLPGWSFLAEGDAQGSLHIDANSPLNDSNPHSMRLAVTRMGTRCGVVNSGYRGMNIQTGQWYDVSFYARTTEGQADAGGMGGRPRGVGLVFSLENAKGKICARATLPEIGGPWRKYTLALHANASDPRGRLIITPIEPVTMWFDVVSLVPRKTVNNRPNDMRPDVTQKVFAMYGSDSGGIFKRGVSPEGLASCYGNGAIAETRGLDDAIRALLICIH